MGPGRARRPLLPGTADDARFVHITRWTQQYAPAGHYRELAAFRARSASEDRTVQIAGEYVASPNLNAAVASGERAGT